MPKLNGHGQIIPAGEIARRVRESSREPGNNCVFCQLPVPPDNQPLRKCGNRVGSIACRTSGQMMVMRTSDIRELSRPLAEEVNPRTLEAMRLHNVELERQVRVLRGTVEWMWEWVGIEGTGGAIDRYLDERSLPWDATADQVIAANLNRDRENGGHSS